MSHYIPIFDLNVLATEDDEEDVGFDLNVLAPQVDANNDLIHVNELQDTVHVVDEPQEHHPRRW